MYRIVLCVGKMPVDESNDEVLQHFLLMSL